MDLGIVETRFAKVVLATATVQDVLLWAALAVATSLAAAQSPSLADAGLAAGRTLAFMALALVLGPPLLRYANRLRINLVLKASRLGYTLIWCFPDGRAGRRARRERGVRSVHRGHRAGPDAGGRFRRG